MTSTQSTQRQDSSKSTHKVELDHLHSLSMTGVVDVPTFTDKLAVVRLANETLQVLGQNMQMKTLDIDSGKLVLTGQVYSLKYSTSSAPTSLVKRIFK